MRIDVATIFPSMFASVLNESIIKRAQSKGLVKINVHNLRNYTKDKHKKIDGRPFGGGPGMVFMPGPIFNLINSIFKKKKKKSARVILLTPQGNRLDQKLVKKLAQYKHLILICGHYEGVDARVRKKLISDEISIGDYVLTCGELPAMVLIDAVVRLIPGVLGKEQSTHFESFNQGLLEYPQYTRPAVYRRMRVPKILLLGNHKRIAEWRRKEALRVTRQKRPDLLSLKGDK